MMSVPPFSVLALDRARVLRLADEALKQAPITVTASHSPRSAGGRHDFFSEGDYWWPDPKEASAPYVQQDGKTNPDNFAAHRQAMVRFSQIVAALVAAFRITEDRKYAAQAVTHLRAWFVDEATRMNPSLLYAQAIRGRFTGRSIGIIDTIHLIEVARATQILQQHSAIPTAARTAIHGWFRDYLHWMTTHPYGLDEKNNGNNHSTCWTMQVAAFASLVNDGAKMDECRQFYKKTLLPGQMDSDGSFPRELKRTKPYGYSLFNLDAMATVCQLLSTPTDSLWDHATSDGRNLRKGAEFLFPFIADKRKWPYAHDVMFWEFWPVRSPALLFAGLAYKEKGYLDLWRTLDPDPTNPEVLRNLPLRQPVLWV